MSGRGRLTCGLAVWLVSVCCVPTTATGADDFATLVRPFLARHCLTCHGTEKQEARIRYDHLAGFRPSDRHLWTLVHEKLSAQEMPPEDQAQPADAERRKILAWIEQSQRQSPGGGTRRLNRREFSAALRDLTGLAIDFGYSLPDDGRVDGFDTGADALQDAADSVAQTMQVVRRAVETLRFLNPASDVVFAADLRQVKDAREPFDRYKAAGLSVSSGDTAGRPGTGLLIKPKWVGDRGGFTLRLPPPANRQGVLRLEIEVSALRMVDGVPHPHLWVEVGGRDLGFPLIDNPPQRPRKLIYEVSLSDVTIDAKGLGITLTNRVELPYAIEGFENEDRSKPEDKLPGGTGLFRPKFDPKTLPLDQQPIPFVVLHHIKIDPDYRAAWPPAGWEADMGKIEDDAASAERLLRLWTERAWRRPVGDAELERFIALYLQLRTDGKSFDAALQGAFQAVLLSGSFRYLTSPADVDSADQQHALAARLSFMLWGAPPDAELRKLAAAGKLRDPAALDRQIDRLLADPRSEAFVRPFVTQWLEMGQPITLAMDHLQKQDFRFGRNLKDSMQAETVGYVARAIEKNRAAHELLSSDWAMMNDILARHYGYDGIAGGTLREVKLRTDDPRGGGIPGHAGIQSMLCWMGENWVIYRGAWALRCLLDMPPPPPPLEVPELIPSDAANRGKPFRELLRQHQADAKCSVCHKAIDPLGFAFQNFDLSGRWRDVEYDHYLKADLDGKIQWRGAGKTRPVDCAGKLPRGEAFSNHGEFRTLLVKHYTPDLVRGWLKKLILYGTGRKADVEDMVEIRRIMAEHASAGYPLRDLSKALIRSPSFIQR